MFCGKKICLGKYMKKKNTEIVHVCMHDMQCAV